MTVARSLLHGLGVVWLAVTLAFLALRVLPGDAITAQMIDSGASLTDINERREALGLNAPLPVQYVRYLSGLARGDMGTSLLSGEPVLDMILQRLAPTLTLGGLALVVGAAFGVTLGTLAALDSGWRTRAARLLIHLSLSAPVYWTGTLAIYVFAALLGLLPSSGAGRASHLVLPVLVLGFSGAGAVARVTQAGIRDAQHADFARSARAKGLRERHVLMRHVLPVALVPVVTVIGLQAGFVLSGTVITESLFVRPGLGRLLLDSTLRQDYPVVQGIVVVAAVLYALVNAGAGVLVRLIDPRVANV